MVVENFIKPGLVVWQKI